MKTIKELKEAVAQGKTLVWNPPHENYFGDFTITWIQPLPEDCKEDVGISIRYNNGENRDVAYLNEIEIKEDS